ncbi:MAG: competence/damage-inducible protein A [Turicibacter sp.]|nr:competence/damage-inducible protein A [Turicibacter sp.]
MTAEIIAVGTELLLGDTVNTNASFLGQELAKLGVSVFMHTTVGDNAERLKKAYGEAFERGADLVIATGGLGPTEDDITKEVAADFLGIPLVLHEESWELIQDLFAKFRPGIAITENNRKQALLPEPKDGVILKNDNGTAPGALFERDGKRIVVLPGPPSELRPMFLKEVMPILQKLSDRVLVSKVLKVAGIGESLLEERIKHIIDAQTNPTIAPYAKVSEVHLRLTAEAGTQTEAAGLIEPVAERLREIIGTGIFGEDDETLESAVAAALEAKGFDLVCAESCTGGMLVSRLIDHAGISAVLREGIVAYSNESKVARLGVDAGLIQKFGAVSPEVATAMAIGAARISPKTVGISTTGIAGPGGGTADKPVGLVYIGLAIPNREVEVKKLIITGNRAKVRVRTTVEALNFLRLRLIEK